jgi:hypothetical protein
VRRFAERRRRVGERELDQGIEVFVLGELLLVARHPARWHGPINRHAGFVHGEFGEGRVVASHFQGNQSPIAVANEQGRAGLGSQGEHILTLFDDAVIIPLRAALASSATLNGVDRKMLSQGACEGGEVARHGKDAGNNKNRWPTSDGEITNRCPILGAHGVGGAYDGIRVTPGHHCSFFMVTTSASCGCFSEQNSSPIAMSSR